MTEYLKRLTTAALLLFLTVSGMTAQSPKREFRSTWMTTVWAIDWPSTRGTTASAQSAAKAEMTAYLDKFAAMNMTGICFQVRSMADAMYRSSYEPWSSNISGTRGVDPGWDPLEWVVAECHKRGLECYAWVNPFRWSSGTQYSTSYDKEWSNKGWLLNYGSYTTFNPGLPAAQEHILNVCREIIDNYAIDGMLFDDYFYPNNIPESSSAGDWALYKNSGTSLSIGDWRRANINKVVKDIYDYIQEARPDVRFGIGPAGVAGKSNTSASRHGVDPCPVSASDWQYSEIYSDPLAWLEEGSIDFISPQIYWTTTHSTAPYGPLTKWWSYVADHFNRHHYSSHSVSFLAEANTSANWKEMATQVQLNRDNTLNNAPGSCYYSARNVNGPGASGLGDYLKSNKYQLKSLVPTITWKEHPSYPAPTGLTYSSGNLSWSAVSNDKAIIRYTVYAVPSSISVDEARASDGDGIDNRYLLGVSYSTSYRIGQAMQSGYWYAVCVYDGYGYEYTPAVVNYPAGESEKAVLIAPEDGATVPWDATFEWSAISNAFYTVEIASDADFSNLLIAESDLSANSTTIDLGNLNENSTYYWRVLTSQTGKIQSASASSTFKTGSRPAAPATTLLSPESGEEVSDNITFSWQAVDGIDGYTLQISSARDFAILKHTADLDADVNTYRLNASTLGKGTWYWRVITVGSHYKDTASETGSFIISQINVGNYEPGYEIKNDPAEYPSQGTLTITNLWYRSVQDGFNNITFDNNGMMNRGMAAKGNCVYLAGRSENSSGARIYLAEYNGSTGEHIRDITLSDEGHVPYYPCNDVIKDSEDNLCITNLVLNVGSTPLYVHLVDLSTGSLTQVASLSRTGLSSSRVDHAAIYGDVTSGNFYVFACIASSNQVVRWTFSGGKETVCDVATISEFYPSSAQNFGIAPRISPINGNEVLIDGGNTTITRYDFSTGKITGSFAQNPSLAPKTFSANGCCHFSLNGKHFTIYPGSDHSSADGYQFSVVNSGTSLSFADMNLYWTIPQSGIGSVNSTTYSAPCDYVKNDEGNAVIYIYVPGNGLAAYHLTDNSTVAAGAFPTDQELKVYVSGKTMTFNHMIDNLSIYSATGALIHCGSQVQTITLPTSGTYVIDADGHRKAVVLR